MKRESKKKVANKVEAQLAKERKRRETLDAKTLQVLEQMGREIQLLREANETWRGMLFGAFLGRALGDEQKLTDAFMASKPEWFRGKEEAPWLAFSA